MRRNTIRFAPAGLALLVAIAGCSANSSKLATCQAEKDQLLTTIRSQRDTTRALEQQVASLETRLDQSEKELARSNGGTRISSRPSETPPTIRDESLPWRAPPAGKTEVGGQKSEVKSQRSEVGRQRSADKSLLAL